MNHDTTKIVFTIYAVVFVAGLFLAICLASVVLAELTATHLTAQRIATVVKNADDLTARLADALTIEIDQNLG